jgi:hypothetical protein
MLRSDIQGALNTRHRSSMVVGGRVMLPTVLRTVLVLVIGCPTMLTNAAPPRASRDFDDDGFDDLVICVNRESIGSIGGAGALHVLYGSANRLTTQGTQFWHQDKPNIAEKCQANDEFASAAAIGDFNHDGHSDLAIGVPKENAARGVVQVLYGASAGLRATGSQLFSQATLGISDTAEPGDEFGRALAAADFNADGFDDLAIAAPFESIAGLNFVGAVHILYGTSSGLSGQSEQFWNREVLGQSFEAGEQFGRALAVGDFDRNLAMDLAIGASSDIEGAGNAGSVQVLYGILGTGLTVEGAQVWHEDVDNVLGTVEEIDNFGRELTTGDFNGDFHDDLATTSVENEVSVVHIIYGSDDGLTGVGDQLLSDPSQDPDPNSQFGAALASGDFDGDGFFDLAIGMPGTTIDRQFGAGAVTVLFGTSNGISTDDFRTQNLNQFLAGLPGTPQEDDQFGRTLAVGNFNGDNRDDLVISVINDTVAGLQGVGTVHVLYGNSIGLNLSNDQFFHQNKAGIADNCESDGFGIFLGN